MGVVLLVHDGVHLDGVHLEAEPTQGGGGVVEDVEVEGAGTPEHWNRIVVGRNSVVAGTGTGWNRNMIEQEQTASGTASTRSGS